MLKATLLSICRFVWRSCSVIAGRVLLICTILFVIRFAWEYTRPLAVLANHSPGGTAQIADQDDAMNLRALSGAGQSSSHGGLNLASAVTQSVNRFGLTSDAEPSRWLDNPHYRGGVPDLITHPALLRHGSFPQQTAIADFNYHGIGFQTTHGQFLKRFPHAKPANSMDDERAVSYAIDDLDGTRDAIWFHFSNGRLSRLGFTYGPERIERRGGPTSLLRQAENWLGTPTQTNGTTTRWSFPAANRSAILWNDQDSWYLAVMRTSMDKKSSGREQSADTGE
jgi:hypothetical protein